MAVLVVDEVTEVRDVVELITYLASWPAETPTACWATARSP